MKLFDGKIMEADSRPYTSQRDGKQYKNYTVRISGTRTFFHEVRSAKLDYKEGQLMPLTLLNYQGSLILVEAVDL